MSKIPQGEWSAIAARHAQGETIAKIAQDYGCTAPAIHYILKRQKVRSAPAGSAPPYPAASEAPFSSQPRPELRSHTQPRPLPLLRPTRPEEHPRETALAFTIGRADGEQRGGDPGPQSQRSAPHGSALSAGLNTQLEDQTEAAIEAFRANFHATITDRSQERLDALRLAASDLMRMAARTIIVVDRLNAGHDAPRDPHGQQPRSAKVG